MVNCRKKVYSQQNPLKYQFLHNVALIHPFVSCLWSCSIRPQSGHLIMTSSNPLSKEILVRLREIQCAVILSTCPHRGCYSAKVMKSCFKVISHSFLYLHVPDFTEAISRCADWKLKKSVHVMVFS